MIKVLYVYGNDYAAVDFENSDYTPKIVYEILERNSETELEQLKEKYGDTEFKILEFGEVDENFIAFVRNDIQDYDISKDQNFYIVR